MAEMTAHGTQVHADHAPAHHDDGHGSVQKRNENLKLAVWLYLASEIVIFAMLMVGYAIFRLNEPDAVKGVHETLGIALVTANTFLLLASSYAMVMALRAIELGKRGEFLRWMWGVVILGIVFIIGQYIEYQELAHAEITLAGIHPDYSGFGMRFYAPTFFHGVHVFVGVLLALWVIREGMKGAYDSNPIGVELFGLYWHFVDVVWIILFTLIYLV